MKAMGEKQGFTNFAGKISSSNATVCFESDENVQIVDTGASDHMIGNKKLLGRKYKNIKETREIELT